MKKILCILTIILAVLSLSPRAAAEGAYFGFRGEGLIPFAGSSFGGTFVVPLFGIQVGYEFGDPSDPGFGVRVSLSSLILINRVSLDGLYRIPKDASGAGLYLGGGADLVFGLPTATPVGIHAVAGYSLPFSSSITGFAELWPGLLIFGGGPLLGYISVGVGVNFHL